MIVVSLYWCLKRLRHPVNEIVFVLHAKDWNPIQTNIWNLVYNNFMPLWEIVKSVGLRCCGRPDALSHETVRPRIRDYTVCIKQMGISPYNPYYTRPSSHYVNIIMYLLQNSPDNRGMIPCHGRTAPARILSGDVFISDNWRGSMRLIVTLTVITSLWLVKWYHRFTS